MRFKDGAEFYTVEQLSPRREKTPEGFLLCKDVPISRVGEFDYTPLETGIAGKGGKVVMSRSEAELFKPETIASFEGKPVVIGHGQFADPDNWRKISIGHVQNVRRGEGEQSSLLLADLLLQDAEGIRLVEEGQLTEVSCGYDAKAIDDGDGRGHQEGIVGNHLALVEKARCGEICKIGDGFMKPKSWKNALRRFFKDGDEEGFNECLDSVEANPVGDDGQGEPAPAPTAEERLDAIEKSVAALTEKVSAMEKPTADEEPPEPQEGAEGNEGGEADPDAEIVADEEVEQVMADADELAPGIPKPQGDGEGGKFTRGLVGRIKRNALKLSGNKTFGDSATLDGQALDVAFKAAVLLARSKNNPTARGFGDGGQQTPARPSNSELNTKYKTFWEGK